MPLLWELCEGKTEEKDFFETYDKVRGQVKLGQQRVKPGVDQFTVLMQLTIWGDYFQKNIIQGIWSETFSGIRVDNYTKSALAKKPINQNFSSYVSTGTSSPKDHPAKSTDMSLLAGQSDYSKTFEMSYGYQSQPPRQFYTHKSAHRDNYFKSAPFKIFSSTVSTKF